MTYLIVEDYGDIREVQQITDDDKRQLVDGTLQIIKFENNKFHWAEIEDEESMRITWNVV